MKILIVKTVPGELNIEKVTYNHQEIGLAKALIQMGHECDIMCCADEKETIKSIKLDDNNYITLYCMKAVKILKNGFYLNVNSIFKKYDVLHVSEYNQLYTWHMAKKYKAKMVCYHGPYYCEFNKNYNKMARFFDVFFLKRYKRLNTKFITKSKLAENYLRNKGLKNVTSIGVGIDREALFSESKDKIPFISQILECEDEKIMYIGRLEPRRNVFFLLDVLKCLNNYRAFSLVLIGTGEKEYVQSFFDKAEKMGIANKIIYLDHIEQRYMYQLYNTCNIFLLPTIYDIYGMVLLEAMFFNQCVLTTVNGGSNMMIDTGINGFVFKEFDAKKWCAVILRLVDDEKLRNQISKNANNTILEGFTWQKLAPQFIKQYLDKLKNEK